MKRIDIVRKRLGELSAKGGVTAGELAKDLGLSRANVSSDLNRMCNEGSVEKFGTRPVYYKISSAAAAEEQNAGALLDRFVRDNPSLYHCVEQAKAAVLYPPHGMHMLLFGETGVGKSMFAELIYQYARDRKCVGKDAPFIVFNCADYANNPQLLVSQLMGTKKGAYTGADTDKPGLLEKADGGFLFLDEVHRLPPQGQEMLFTFIDRGVYRRLGETENERKATVLLICATTEDPDSTLLKTFVRRIPMIIKIPNLSERNMDERLNLISHFFRNESARLGKPISVSVNSMRALLSYRCPNNVGQLKNDILIICAKAYSDYISGKKEDLRVVSFDLPDYIKQGLYLETTHRQIWNRLIGINKRYCVFDSSSKELLLRNNEDAENIYEMIETRMQELKERGISDEEISKEISNEIRLYYKNFLDISEHPQDFSSITNLVGVEVMAAVDKILMEAQKKLARDFGNNIRYGLAVHIYNSINRVRRGRKIINPQLNLIRKEHAAEFSVALDSLKILNQEFNLTMPIDEAGFLAVFFDIDHLVRIKENEKVQVIVVAHGTTTASSMASVANRLLDMNCVIGIDASLDENPQKVYSRLKERLLRLPQKSNLLLLVDMGSLTNFSSDLEEELKIQVKTIPLVSTLHVIEAARKAALGYPLDYVYQETLSVNELLTGTSRSAPNKNKLAKMFILTICTTGEGSAQLLKNILDSQLNYHNAVCETIALKLADTESISTRLASIRNIGKIICIVSTFKIDLDVAQFGLTDVLEGNAVQEIQRIIDKENTLIEIGHTLANMLKNINSHHIFDDIRSVIQQIETQIERQLLSDVLVGVFCHIACMVDRILGKSPLSEFPDKQAYIEKNSGLFQIVRSSCGILENKFEIRIPNDEICYISSFFMPENCVSA
ncbi:MAG: Nitric oxide reductase transcription regulator NorR2 [Eubacteriales bacterium]|jgi:transcriptional regulatory protein LevR/transcriptional regulator with AAA-type ATPase domain